MRPDWESAAKTGDAAALAAQIAAGADVDARDRFGQTALMLAAQRGHHEAVARALAEAGADLASVGSGAPGFAGKTAAQLARDRGLEALADALQTLQRRPGP